MPAAGVMHRLMENGIRKELAARDHHVDARDIHVHHAARANVQVADFAVAHLALGQPHKRPRRLNQRVRKIA